MKISNNLIIILGAILVTGAIFVLMEAGNLGMDDYLGIAALVGGALALFIGYRFLMAYAGRLKSQNQSQLYAELRPYESPVASGKITLFFSLPEKDLVSLYVTDMNGTVIHTLINAEKEAGDYPVKFDTLEVENGIYFYELKTSNYRNSKKLIIQN